MRSKERLNQSHSHNSLESPTKMAQVLHRAAQDSDEETPSRVELRDLPQLLQQMKVLEAKMRLS